MRRAFLLLVGAAGAMCAVDSRGLSVVETPELCARHADESYRAWCRANIIPPSEAFARAAHVQQQLRSCAWADNAPLRERATLQVAPGVGDPGAVMNMTPRAVTYQQCVLQGAELTTLLVRVGPHSSVGGFDWVDYSSPIMPPGMRAGERIPVRGIFLGIAEEGSWRLLGSPPYHIHHSILFGGATGSTLPHSRGGIQMALGGDMQCTQAGGGIGCLVYRYPKGFARFLELPLQHAQLVNDIRPLGSPPLNAWAVAAVTWATAMQRPALLPVRQFLMWSYSEGARRKAELPHFNAYIVPGDRATHTVQQELFPRVDARVVWTWNHLHEAWAHSATWFVNATAAQLGFDDSAIYAVRPGLNQPALERALERARALPGVTVCSWVRERMGAHLDTFDASAVVGARYFWTLSSSCQPFRIAASPRTPYVTFGQFAPVANEPTVALPRVGMHTFMLVEYVTEKAAAAAEWRRAGRRPSSAAASSAS